MPHFSVRHLASSNSALDSVQGYGLVRVESGTVSMQGLVAGRCNNVSKLGSVPVDRDGLVTRDLALILFASNKWSLALRIVSALGAGRYSGRKRAVLAQVLVSNYHRAKLAVLEHKISRFKPIFRSGFQKFVWSDFMVLQIAHMRMMNDNIVFMATLSNSLTTTDIMIVTAGERPSGNLWAIDFGALSESGKTMLIVVQAPEGVSSAENLAASSVRSAPLHKIGVSSFTQLTSDLNDVAKYSAHIIDRRKLQRFEVGGSRCPVCYSSTRAASVPATSVARATDSAFTNEIKEFSSASKYATRIQMRRQERAIKVSQKKRARRQKRVA